MTKEEFKAAREKFGYSAEQMGQFLWGKTARMVYYYESGEYVVPESCADKINQKLRRMK